MPSYFPENNTPSAHDSTERAAQKALSELIVLLGDAGPIFPFGNNSNAPQPDEDLRRTMIKMNAVIYNSTH